MDKAFDAVLQTEVEAPIIAKNAAGFYGEHYRYRCLYCGEEVYLAAADSKVRTPHFRHRRGNNDTECEKYLGQYGGIEQLVSLRMRIQKKVEFCFNSDRYTFEICISLGEEAISEYEEKKERMIVSAFSSSPFLSILINKESIIPGKNYYTITELSTSYWVSFDSGTNRHSFSDVVIKESGGINCFRVKMQDEHSPQQTSGILYSDTDYYAISDNEESIHAIEMMGKAIQVLDAFSFTTCGIAFFGIRFSIVHIEQSVKQLFAQYDYRVEASEDLSILWPPTYSKGSDIVCSSDVVYTYSSFPLIPKGNTNAYSSSIKKMNMNVHEIAFEDTLVIHEKNVDVSIKRKQDVDQDYCYEEPETEHTSKYVIPDRYDYYLFDQNGCSHLISGSTVYLSNIDRIVGYQNGHIKALVFGLPDERMDTQQMLEDILKYHPQNEKFIPDEFMSVKTDDTIIDYLEKCYRKGTINSVVRRYIKEGLI